MKTINPKYFLLIPVLIVALIALVPIFSKTSQGLPSDKRGIVAEILGSDYQFPDYVVVLNWTSQPETGTVTLNFQDKQHGILVTLTRSRLSDELYKAIHSDNVAFLHTMKSQTHFSKPPRPNEVEISDIGMTTIGDVPLGVGHTQTIDNFGNYHPGSLMVVPQKDEASVMISGFLSGKFQKDPKHPEGADQKAVEAVLIELINQSKIGDKLP